MSLDAWNPEQYDKFKNERSQPFYDLMALLQPQTQARIIDLGCGTGELTSELHQSMHASETTGLDSSAEMLKKAKAIHAKDLSFKKANVQNWCQPNSYNIIFSNAALQHCDDHPMLFARLKESLRPGGQLAIQMPMNHDYPTHLLANSLSHEEPWLSLLKGEAYERQKAMLSVEDYASLLFKLGFKEQKVMLNVYGHILTSREDVIEWVKGSLLTYFKSRLSESDYKNFVTEFREHLFKKLPDDRPFFYPFKRIFLWAKN